MLWTAEGILSVVMSEVEYELLILVFGLMSVKWHSLLFVILHILKPNNILVFLKNLNGCFILRIGNLSLSTLLKEPFHILLIFKVPSLIFQVLLKQEVEVGVPAVVFVGDLNVKT